MSSKKVNLRTLGVIRCIFYTLDLIRPANNVVDRLIRKPVQSLLEGEVISLRPPVLFVIVHINEHVHPFRKLIKEREHTHLGNRCIRRINPGGRIGVEVIPTLVKKLPELGRHGDLRNTVYLLNIAILHLQVIRLPRGRTELDGAENIQIKAHRGLLGVEAAAFIFYRPGFTFGTDRQPYLTLSESSECRSDRVLLIPCR